jgi:hypothetical protein
MPQAAFAVYQRFMRDGLLARSVQAHAPHNFKTDVDSDLKPGDSVVGQHRDCWSFIHPWIKMPLYQMSNLDVDPQKLAVGRSMAMLVDWTATWDRVVDAVVQDASSNQTFVSGKLPAKLTDLAQDMEAFIGKLATASSVTNNEVRTIQVKNSALVGFIWSPSVKSAQSILNKAAGSDWKKDAKPHFQKYVDTICSRQTKEDINPVTQTTFPVFGYIFPNSDAKDPEDVFKRGCTSDSKKAIKFDLQWIDTLQAKISPPTGGKH